jgi:hypothetical protein
MFRDRIQELQNAAAQNRDGTSSRTVTSGLRKLRDSLSTRGLLTVYDPTHHMPGQVPLAAAQDKSEATSTSAGNTTSTIQLDAAVTNTGPATSSPMAADWAANSVTVNVQE